MTFGDKVLNFHKTLKPDWPLPEGFGLLFPFDQPETLHSMGAFYHKYYGDQGPRVFIFGINPGRFGAGITGVPFTDPVRLAEVCGIANPFHKRQELSSVFIYHIVEAMGGPEIFYRDHYITSVCPLGFIRNGVNVNYYDDRQLQTAVEPYIIDNFNTQLPFGARGREAVCLGQGKNFKYLQKLNERMQWFDKIHPLPHPRWVMQYRRKTMDKYIEDYRNCFLQLPLS